MTEALQKAKAFCKPSEDFEHNTTFSYIWQVLTCGYARRGASVSKGRILAT
jgi:hypothetical protein